MNMNTPIYIKTGEEFPWPEDKFFYLLASEGLFLCRNHPFFQSCTKVKDGPKELSGQKAFLRLSYPKLPQALVERAVGFLRLVAEKQNSEAAAIWIWNRSTEQVELIIPDQTAINSAPSHWSPNGFPMDVHYEIPPLAPEQAYIGDIHCHVDGGAYASYTDEADETYRPGIHLVVGHIADAKPDFYGDAVVDGERFKIEDLALVWEGFKKADTASVPLAWLDKVKLQENKYETSHSSSYNYPNSTGHGSYPTPKPTQSDKEIINRMLEQYEQRGVCPKLSEVEQTLFGATKEAAYTYCEKRAKQFIEGWKKAHHEKQTA